jgi:hypothetical protein
MVVEAFRRLIEQMIRHVVRFKHSPPISAGYLSECLNQRTTRNYKLLMELWI